MTDIRVLSWHGGLLRAAGHIQAQADAGVTDLVVPAHHRGTEPHIIEAQACGMRIIRSLEPPWNAGRERMDGTLWDLGAVLTEWDGPANPGWFFRAFLEAADKGLQEPCDGLAWNLEHSPGDYPLTHADCTWAKEMHVPTRDPVELRCWQFSLLVRLYQAAAEHALGKALPFYAYSLYGGLTVGDLTKYSYAGPDCRTLYSCSWDLLSRPITYRGVTYRSLDYAAPSWHGITLPLRANVRRIPAFHNLGLPFYGFGNDAERWRDYRLVAEDRVRVCRGQRDAGIAFVAAGKLDEPWGADDDRLLAVVREALGR